MSMDKISIPQPGSPRDFVYLLDSLLEGLDHRFAAAQLCIVLDRIDAMQLVLRSLLVVMAQSAGREV